MTKCGDRRQLSIQGSNRGSWLEDHRRRYRSRQAEHAVCAVDAVVNLVVLPLIEPRVIGSLEECASAVAGKVGGQGSSDGDLVSVLHVSADARSVEDHRDVQCFEFGGGANSGVIQELWGVEYATREDDFASGKERSGAGLVCSARVGISTVQMASLDITNSDGARRGRCAIKDNAGDKRTELDGELKLLGRVEDHHPLTGTSTRRVGDGERDLVDSGGVVAGWGSIVDIGDHHGRYELDRVDHAGG